MVFMVAIVAKRRGSASGELELLAAEHHRVARLGPGAAQRIVQAGALDDLLQVAHGILVVEVGLREEALELGAGDAEALALAGSR